MQTDIPARQQKIYAVYSDLSGAFFEFSWNFRKAHRFFIGVFRKLSNKFEPDILEQLLQDVRLFVHRTTTTRYAGEPEKVLLMRRKEKPPVIE